jgi:putative aldouronate transport system substrate-binding protein
MTMLNQWFADGLIDPSWTSYDNNTMFTDKITTSQVGYVYMSPGEVSGYEMTTTDSPDCQWVPIHKPLLTPDQTVHVGGEKARIFYGSAIVSQKCENIPLAVTWIDWRYSPEGYMVVSYGPEGTLWEKDENGNMVATESALNAPDALPFAWACMLYGLNALAEPGMEATARKYIVPGGDRLLAMHAFWDDYNYDGAYKWPTGAKFTEDQTEEMNQYSSDIITYISENYTAFVDGSKPLSEWDAYVSQLRSLGVDRVIEIYQEAYDTFMASQE